MQAKNGVFSVNEAGVEVMMKNIATLSAGDSVTVRGLSVNTIQFVKERPITQFRRPDNDPKAEPQEVEVPQYHFSLGGRSFTITGDGLKDKGAQLLATIKGTAKGDNRVKEVYLIANEWHPQRTDAEGNKLWEDEDETIPSLNTEITNRSFTFSGTSTAGQVAEEQDDALAYEAKRKKLNLTTEAAAALSED